jgi:predicted alpha-1,6-mannanase (GH76 family)
MILPDILEVFGFGILIVVASRREPEDRRREGVQQCIRRIADIWLGDRVIRSYYDDLVTAVATTRGRWPEHRKGRRYD